MKAFFALLMLAAVAHADPEFVGVVSTKDGASFAVSLGPGRPSQWVKVGAIIDGYLVLEYRGKEEVLVLKKGEKLFLLNLRTAKVRESPVTQSPGAAPPNEELSNARQKALATESRIRELQAKLANLQEAKAKSQK
jgi:hypothetical protein